MKKVILFLLFGILFLNNINANEAKIISNPYKQTQVTSTVFPSLINYHSGWFKKDSVNITFDFIKNDKIVIYENNSDNVYKILNVKTIKYDIGSLYKMKAADSKHNKYNIEVLYYNDNSVMFTIINDSVIVRYKFAN